MGIGSTITISLSEYTELLKIKEEHQLLKLRVLELVNLVASLQEEIRLLRNGKNSATSHTPPSHQPARSNAKSLREKTERKTGGQPGHEGTTLQIKEAPDETVNYVPGYCNDCDEDLQQVISVLKESKQEVIIPPVQVRYVQHCSYSKVCTKCGKVCSGQLPSHLKAPIQYGHSVGALVSYLSVYQYIPYHRIKVLLKDVFALPISEGSIDNLLERTAQKALPLYHIIQQKIQQSQVVGSDETGASVAGKKGWFIPGKQQHLPLSWHL